MGHQKKNIAPVGFLDVRVCHVVFKEGSFQFPGRFAPWVMTFYIGDAPPFIEILWLGRSFTGLNFFEPQTTQANKSPPNKITSNICMNFDPLLNMESNFMTLKKPRNPRCVLQKIFCAK